MPRSSSWLWEQPVGFCGDPPASRSKLLGCSFSALAALYVDLDLGGYFVAAGLISHAGWDAVHYLRNRVVAR